MNRYTFEEIQIGMKASFEVWITEDELKLFGQITGDKNPLHTSNVYANKQGYHGKVVYGLLTAAYLSRLAGMYLRGVSSLFLSVVVIFRVGLIIDGGKKLTVRGTVTEVDERFKVFTLKVEIIADNCKICRGKMHIGVR